MSIQQEINQMLAMGAKGATAIKGVQELKKKEQSEAEAIETKKAEQAKKEGETKAKEISSINEKLSRIEVEGAKSEADLREISARKRENKLLLQKGEDLEALERSKTVLNAKRMALKVQRTQIEARKQALLRKRAELGGESK